MLGVVFRPTRAVNVSDAANEINLNTQLGSPAYPLNVICKINAAVGSTNISNPAFRTGTGWYPGSLIIIDMANTITGATGTAGTSGNPGSPGTNGTNGTPGNGGAGGQGEIGRAHV